MEISLIFILILGYLLGSLPWSYWICMIFYRQDITKMGSGNPGMTNVLRNFGWKPAVPAGILDTAKGFIACYFAYIFGSNETWILLTGIAAIIGHSATPFLRFRGGKGVLTSLGVFLFLVPISAILAFVVWGITVAISRYVSLGSIFAAITLPISVMWEKSGINDPSGRPILLIIALTSIFIIWRHRSNIKRILSGTESKFGRRTA